MAAAPPFSGTRIPSNRVTPQPQSLQRPPQAEQPGSATRGEGRERSYPLPPQQFYSPSVSENPRSSSSIEEKGGPRSLPPQQFRSTRPTPEEQYVPRLIQQARPKYPIAPAVAARYKQRKTPDPAWVQQMITHYKALLKNSVDPRLLPQLFTEDKLPTWIASLTFPTVDPVKNYEPIEYLGDRLYDGVFGKYLHEELPGASESVYTNLHIFYMSKDEQSVFSKQMGLDKLVRIKGVPEITPKILTDLFEAFGGALFLTSEMIMPGIGFSVLYNFIVDLFKDITFSEVAKMQDAKTMVIQMFRGFGLPQLKSQFEHDIATDQGYMVQARIFLPKEILDFISKAFPQSAPLVTPLIGQALGFTEDLADKYAFTNAYENLARAGVSFQAVQKLKKDEIFSAPEVQPVMAALWERLAREGFEDVRVGTPTKGKAKEEGQVFQVVGIAPDGNEYPVLTRYYEADWGKHRPKVDMLVRYARGEADE